MRKIIKIVGIEERKDRHGRVFYRTHALLDDGNECVGFGLGFEIGNEVESFYDDKWQVAKMKKPENSADN